MEGVELRPEVRPPSGSVPWPFDRIRDGQSDFLQDARRTLADGKHLLAHAPTGIGKTAVALVAALDNALTAQELVRASGACGVCPHRVAMDAAAKSRLVVCDYNYVFSEIRERFLPRLGRSLEDLILIVDEAHNLPDRIRAHLVGDLAVMDLLKAAKEARSIDGEVAHELVGVAKSMERFLTALRSERIARKDEFLDVVEAGLRRKGGETRGYPAFVAGLAFAGEDAGRRGGPSHLPAGAEFFVRWRGQGEGILRLVVPGPDRKFALRLLDPSGPRP